MRSGTQRVEISSDLGLPSELVWARVCTMEGVNAELAPWLRMTVPPEARGKRLMATPLGVPMFTSWLLLGGVLPIDRHCFCLEVVEQGRFQERSHSWLQASWDHERRVEEQGGGCRVTDALEFRPRLPFVGWLMGSIVRRVFAHRHAQLSRWAEALTA